MLGRVVVAALVAAAILLVRRERPPAPALWRRLAAVAAAIVLGFPILSSLALSRLPSAHLTVLFGVVPLATSLVARLRGGERPPPRFWLAALVGLAAVVIFAVARGGGDVRRADALALAAVAVAAFGYSEGALLAREIGGWRVLCWALVIAGPPMVAGALVAGARVAAPACGLARAPVTLGIAYLGVISMLLAFMAWYRGLALGGIAKASQLQLAQMPLSLLWSALLLGEKIGPAEIATAAAVVACLVVVVRTPVSRPAPILGGRS